MPESGVLAGPPAPDSLAPEPDPTRSPRRGPCSPCCLLLTLVLLFSSLLASWVILRLTVGARMDPFRISSGYSQPSDTGTAAFDPDFTTNCTLGKIPVPQSLTTGLIYADMFFFVIFHGTVLPAVFRAKVHDM